MIKRTRIDSSDERLILTGMIVSTEFLRQVAPMFSVEAMSGNFARSVSSWCLEHFERYSTAPSHDIQDIFTARQGTMDDKDIELVDEFLASLSDEYEREDKLNVNYLLDKAEQFFKGKSLLALRAQINSCLIQGDNTAAERAITEFRSPARPASDGINPFVDADAIRHALERDSDQLVSFAGAFGDLINQQLRREALVAFQAPEKRGKSYIEMEIAFRAALARCNTAVIQAGDMSQDDMVIRIHERLAGQPVKLRGKTEILVPTLDCRLGQAGQCNQPKAVKALSTAVEGMPQLIDLYRAGEKRTPCIDCIREKFFRGSVWYKTVKLEQLDWRTALMNGRKIEQRMLGKHFKLITRPTKTLNVKGINAIFDDWEQTEGWVPDVIVIDYADILAPEDSRMEFRHQQNETWAALRSLSLTRHALVVTATQAAASAYERESQKLGDFSEDKRKYAHVTATYALNRTEDEKRAGLMRVGALQVRDEEFFIGDEVTILQALGIGQPCIASFR